MGAPVVSRHRASLRFAGATTTLAEVWVKTEALLKEWRRIVEAVPERLLAAAREEVTLRDYTFVSHRMMYLMGWAPGMAGIGKTKRGQGRPEPVYRSESARPTPQG